MAESKLSKLYDWLDERTGIKEVTREALDEPIRGGTRWAYVLGSVLLFLFGIQVVTGIFLSLYYAPTADHAHASVSYIQKAVTGGALLRGLHHYGATAMVIVAVAHLAQTFLFGAYKKKRELLWGAGVLMLLIILAFSFTGYLLPWDQAAYFGTKVGTNIAGEIPVIGPAQQRVMLGGNDLTTMTLSRFFTTHVFLLPLALAGLVGLHLYLFRRATPAGPYHNRDDKKIERFYPKQLFKDSVAMLICFAALIAMTRYSPVELGPVADPTSDYLARPPWYFMPLFQLLKYFPGKWAIIPTVVMPAVLFGALFLLPFFDRREERHPLRRPLATGLLTLIIAGSIGLIFLAKHEDRTNPEFAEQLKKQEEEMRVFFDKPFEPQIVGAGAAPLAAAAKPVEPPEAYAASCSACHGDNGEGSPIATGLIGVSSKPQRSKDDLLKILDDSTAYGLKPPMPKSFPKISPEDKQKIVEWMTTLKP
ncbi:MAG TPA: cytochrome b N-terminal domain-containing protein [Blastocatellia bacterium]|jgi:ubiquinol-cytochrome c reductase cytochrome b subunit|nr:cytochrome b N-terminal domain-containing protein [Blastocatellia bacterium]